MERKAPKWLVANAVVPSSVSPAADVATVKNAAIASACPQGEAVVVEQRRQQAGCQQRHRGDGDPAARASAEGRLERGHRSGPGQRDGGARPPGGQVRDAADVGHPVAD